MDLKVYFTDPKTFLLIEVADADTIVFFSVCKCLCIWEHKRAMR